MARNTASARVTASMASASRWPIVVPILSRFTDMALSTMTCDRFRNPLAESGSIVVRIRGGINQRSGHQQHRYGAGLVELVRLMERFQSENWRDVVPDAQAA